MQRTSGRSIWTGRRSDALVAIEVPGMTRFGGPAPSRTVLVEPEHEEEVRRFIDYALRNGKRFIALLIGGSLASLTPTLAGSPSWGFMVSAAAIAMMGGAMIVYPFATPETVDTLGIRKSVKAARAGGLLLIGIAIASGIATIVRM